MSKKASFKSVKSRFSKKHSTGYNPYSNKSINFRSSTLANFSMNNRTDSSFHESNIVDLKEFRETFRQTLQPQKLEEITQNELDLMNL